MSFSHPTPSSHPANPLSVRGLDHNNNPIMDDGLGNRAMDEALAAVEPIRDVDWHAGPQEILGPAKRRAAHGQRCGMVAPQGQSCHRCKNGKRPFSTCVVNKVNGTLQSKGSCMNCDWLGESARCSFRQSPSLPDWVLEYANANGQAQPAAQQPAATSNYEAAPPFTAGPDPAYSMTPLLGALGQRPLNWWYNSPRNNVDLLKEGGMPMSQIQQELIQAYHQVVEDLAWATEELEKELKNSEQA